MTDDYTRQLHANGVHTRCRLAPLWAGVRRIGDGTPAACPLAGKVERFHSHDHDGPLDCGCDDYG